MAADLNRFIALLKTDLSLLGQLEQTLLTERSALEDRQLDRLQQATQQKLDLLQQVRQNARERQSWLDSTGLPAKRFLELMAVKAPAVHSLYRQAEQKLGDIKRQNDVNGRILHRSQQVTERLLDILRGKGLVRTMVYGNDGRTRADAGSGGMVAQA